MEEVTWDIGVDPSIDLWSYGVRVPAIDHVISVPSGPTFGASKSQWYLGPPGLSGILKSAAGGDPRKAVTREIRFLEGNACMTSTLHQ